MKLTVLNTAIGLGQIFDPKPIEYDSLGQIVKRVLEASTPDLALQITGMAGGGPVKMSEVFSFVISTIEGATAGDLKAGSTQYATGDLAGRTTYALTAFLSADDTSLGSLGQNDQGARTLSILSLADGFPVNGHVVDDVKSFVIDQPNQRILMSTATSFNAVPNANVKPVATFSKGVGSFME